jgi:hypothetical protein
MLIFLSMDAQYTYAPFFKKAIGIFCLFFLINGCKNPQNLAQQVKDNDLTLQVMPLPNGPSHDQVYSYKARLMPRQTLLDDKSQGDKDALIYQMDSCFYLQGGLKKIYASLVQEVPDGVTGTYEYLLQFETVTGKARWDFIYQDKYLNHKKYKIGLN